MRARVSDEGDCRMRILLTPGPVNISPTVKNSMLRDYGHRDAEFASVIATVRRRLLGLSEVSDREYTAVLMPGSGTLALESVLMTLPQPVLFISNGVYGDRLYDIMDSTRGCIREKIRLPIHRSIGPRGLDHIESALMTSDDIQSVVVVHCETSTGVLNPIEKIGEIIKEYAPRVTYVVDAMSSFGAVPIDIQGCGIDYLISSPNKCLRGVPGFAFVIARESLIKAAEPYECFSLDLSAQYRHLQKTGLFRFTPPVQSILAFETALAEIASAGGLGYLHSYYRSLNTTLREGMRELGLREYLKPTVMTCPVITAFKYPEHKNFQFQKFYNGLKSRGFLIYPGSQRKRYFRVGNIGYISPEDIPSFLYATKSVLRDIGVTI